MSFSPNDIYREIVTAGDKWAEAEYQASRMEEMKKALECQLTVEFMAGGKESAASASAKAKADQRYITHIEGMCAAREQANKAKVRYQAAIDLSNNRRTQTVNDREQNRAA